MRLDTAESSPKSNSWSGRVPITCDIPSSLHSETTKTFEGGQRDVAPLFIDLQSQKCHVILLRSSLGKAIGRIEQPRDTICCRV